jgi:hypothetical protein
LWFGFGVFAKLFGKAKVEPTFKERVEDFWVWFAGVADRFAEDLKGKKTMSLAEEISPRVDKLGPGFAWEIGPEGEKNGLTLSGEGNLHRQLLTQYWLQKAPSIPGWIFHPSRQPGKDRGSELVFDEKTFNCEQIWVSPTVNREEEAFDIAVWHPEWRTLTENQRWTMLFIFLDTLLGEYGTQQWIGEIKFSEDQLKDAMGLTELPGFIQQTCEKEGWKSHAPGETGVVYRLEPHDHFARGDISIGSTMNEKLLNDYLRAEGNLEDPLSGTGADYVYLTLSIEHIPKGEEVRARAVFDDALDEQLGAEDLGRSLGGATGSRFGYIDLLIFDGEQSVAAIERILKEKNAPEGMRLNYFAKEKRKLGRKIS